MNIKAIRTALENKYPLLHFKKIKISNFNKNFVKCNLIIGHQLKLDIFLTKLEIKHSFLSKEEILLFTIENKINEFIGKRTGADEKCIF